MADTGHGLTTAMVVLDETLVMIFVLSREVRNGGEMGGIAHFVLHVKRLRHVTLYLVAVDVAL